jgi:hypothetical protein
VQIPAEAGSVIPPWAAGLQIRREREAIVHILDQKGQQGWELVQVTFRQSDFICIWRREL